jgi:hypothetical protein
MVFSFDDVERAKGTGPLGDCDVDAVAALKEMFVDIVMGRRLASGQSPALRPVFLKPHGIALGTFEVRSDLPDELRVGFLQHEQTSAVVRISSDSTPRRPDYRTTIGIAIKLIGIPGRKLLFADAVTCDFLLQNHNVFFVDSAKDMCEFTHAGVITGNYDEYLSAHPKTKRILDEMEKVAPSSLKESYWGLLPHRFGDDRFVKYKLAPAPGSQEFDLSLDPATTENYLYVDLKTRLLRDSATFHFYIQLRTDAATMPLDEATVLWDESESPPVHVATLTLPRQSIDAVGQAQYGENLAFNIWQTLPEHEPQGTIAVARQVAYYEAAKLRRETNGVSTEEPSQPEPMPQPPQAPDQTIVRAEVYPPIGIARVGNSVDAFFIGPEVPHPKPENPGFYRDAHGAIKRQATRFRIYGYNKAGEVVKELTVDDAVIDWKVHVANKKAAWYKFTLAMDIPEVNRPEVEPARRRNAQIAGEDRRQLEIDPGARTIHGRNTEGSTYHFDSGKFLGEGVSLGELRTDDAGRLIFLGGRGVSRSLYGARPYDFANNDGWYDDVSDGPVTARVWMDGVEIPVEPAWVVVAPPNYAPELKSIRTLYDLMVDVSGGPPTLLDPAAGVIDPGTVSFSRHILPIFERMCQLQWVNGGFASHFGWGGVQEFLRPDYLARLSSLPNAQTDSLAAREHAELRTQVFNSFRNYENNNGSRSLWPWIYGDSMDIDGSQHLDLALSNLQLARLRKWANGDFVPDYNPTSTHHDTLEKVPLVEQPATLTEAALSYCLADAFHPGCEITWVIRFRWLFSRRFRIKHRPASMPESDYGDVLLPHVALATSGPLSAFGPGDLTKWMAIPWQTDTASCRSDYEDYTPFTPTFWPARVPNHVLSEEDYAVVMDKKRPIEERMAAFRRRHDWLRVLDGQYFDQILHMVTQFGKLGIVERRPGPGDPAFPDYLFVESLPKAAPPGPAIAPAVAPLAAMAPGAVPPIVTLPLALSADEEQPEPFFPKIHRFKRAGPARP